MSTDAHDATSSASRGSGGAQDSDPGVQLALAEYDALRAEILNARSTQGTLVGAGVAAVGLVFAFSAQVSQRDYLLAVPPLAFVVSMLHLAESRRIHRLGDYIRLTVWPYLTRGGCTYKASWEEQHARPAPNKLLAIIGFEAVVPLLFVGISLVAMWYSGEPWSSARALLDLVAVACILVVPAVFGLTHKRR